jgi:SAM-dependent methyltransferase
MTLSSRRRRKADPSRMVRTSESVRGLGLEPVREIYDALAKTYAEHYESGNPDRPFLDEFLRHVKKGSRVLDLGCGTGSGARYLFEHGMQVEGIDLSRRMIEVAKRRHPEIRFRRADFRHLDYQAGGFDAVWAGYSLFHMVRKDFESTLEKIRCALVASGTFGLTVQEGRGQVYFPEPLLPGKKLLVCLYSREELGRILRAKGFKLIAHKRRRPASDLEYPYNKLLMISRASACRQQ